MSLALRLFPLAAVLLAPAIASAEPVLGGSEITFERNLQDEDGDFTPAPTNDTDYLWERQFNLARCYCGQTGVDDFRAQFGEELRIEPLLSGTVADPVHVWLGVDCLNPDPTQRRCGMNPQAEIGDADDLNEPSLQVFNVYDLHNADGTRGCSKAEYTGGIYAAPSPDGSTTYEAAESFEDTWELDTQPPPVPAQFVRASGSENGVYLDWEPIEENEDDIYKWQVLCAKVDPAAADGVVPAFERPTHTALWETAEVLCGASTTETYVATDLALPEPLAVLDPDYVCGEADGAVSEIRVNGLDNDAEYYVVLVAIDQSRNVAGIAPDDLLRPQEVIDFWEDLHANGSEVEGGFCAVGGSHGGAGGALPSLLLVLAVVWRRRRALVLAAAILLAPAAAGAQSFAPYWEDEVDVDDDGPDDVKWHAGMKFGPYVPAIDAQAGTGADGLGPYERMYGGYEILPTLEVDWLFWHPPGGQLGIGGSIGVMGKTANAFSFEDANGNGAYDLGETLTREKGNRSKFRLVPTALTAIYRFTMLDDEWGIPVVPYLRGGLSYYVWWNTRPDGALSTVPDGGKARGASLGLQGSIGLAIRAENIDPAAAASMRDGGIYHAGFYGEYQLGWVDGFGSEKKLAVGDNTWFAGVNFEF